LTALGLDRLLPARVLWFSFSPPANLPTCFFLLGDIDRLSSLGVFFFLFAFSVVLQLIELFQVDGLPVLLSVTSFYYDLLCSFFGRRNSFFPFPALPSFFCLGFPTACGVALSSRTRHYHREKPMKSLSVGLRFSFFFAS